MFNFFDVSFSCDDELVREPSLTERSLSLAVEPAAGIEHGTSGFEIDSVTKRLKFKALLHWRLGML